MGVPDMPCPHPRRYLAMAMALCLPDLAEVAEILELTRLMTTVERGGKDPIALVQTEK